MDGDVGVALCGVQVLVSEELLDLSEVGVGAQELGGEDVAQRVGGDALSLGHAGRVRVAEERSGEHRWGEPFALHTGEQRRLVQRQSQREILHEQLCERGMQRHDTLTSALGVAYAQQPPVEVDVVPVQAQEL